ncbi:MAG: DUF1343 domain-containing protein [Planctomycetota bacterium]
MNTAQSRFRVAWVFGVLLGTLGLFSCSSRAVRTGLGVLQDDDFERLHGRKVAVLTNHTGCDSNFESLVDLLAAEPKVDLVAIFGPEHGFRGGAQAGEHVGDAKDLRTGVPVFSLYGKTRKPTPEMLEGVDVVVFDIQDIGVRTYTYLSSLILVLEACADRGVDVVVLDRPVPGGATRVGGPVLNSDFESFVGAHTVALRHGMTAGEFARMVNRERGIDANLEVVGMKGYSRTSTFAGADLPWVAPSPNIPTEEIAVIYAGMVLIEGTNLSEGRGTTRPFQLVGAPWIDGAKLAGELRSIGFPGVGFREATFTPTFSKFKGEACRGVEIHVTDASALEPVVVAVGVLTTIRRLYPEQLTFRESAFDKLSGGGELRRAIEDGESVDSIVSSWRVGLANFLARRKTFLLY